MSDTTKRQTIDHMERMPSSKLGNPRFRVFFTDGTSAPTKPDAMWALEAENTDYRDTELVVSYNGRGHITYARKA